MQLGQRIMIIGSGGAGKSTLARQLGVALGLPVIHLDSHFWQPGWVEMPKDEWLRTVEEFTRSERWIIDGNYGGTLKTRMAAADTILFLDYPWSLCLLRVLKRQLQYRGRTRPDLTPGCIEKVEWEFVKWICLDFPRHTRPRIMQLLQEHQENTRIIIHRSPGETSRMLKTL